MNVPFNKWILSWWLNILIEVARECAPRFGVLITERLGEPLFEKRLQLLLDNTAESDLDRIEESLREGLWTANWEPLARASRCALTNFFYNSSTDPLRQATILIGLKKHELMTDLAGQDPGAALEELFKRIETRQALNQEFCVDEETGQYADDARPTFTIVAQFLTNELVTAMAMSGLKTILH